MGNYVSCALSKTTSSQSLSSSSSAAKVILPDGEVRDIHSPTKAAELMMEMPNHFLVEAKSMKIGRKFIPLAADDDLNLGSCHVYVAFPMTRVACAVNASDMARPFLAGKKRTKSCDNRRVSPEKEGDDDVRLIGPKLNLEDIGEFSAAEFIHRISVSKSKKPQLETIVEEHVSWLMIGSARGNCIISQQPSSWACQLLMGWKFLLFVGLLLDWFRRQGGKKNLVLDK